MCALFLFSREWVLFYLFYDGMLRVFSIVSCRRQAGVFLVGSPRRISYRTTATCIVLEEETKGERWNITNQSIKDDDDEVTTNKKKFYKPGEGPFSGPI